MVGLDKYFNDGLFYTFLKYNTIIVEMNLPHLMLRLFD
jgi:hypothetical protein